MPMLVSDKPLSVVADDAAVVVMGQRASETLTPKAALQTCTGAPNCRAKGVRDLRSGS